MHVFSLDMFLHLGRGKQLVVFGAECDDFLLSINVYTARQRILRAFWHTVLTASQSEHSSVCRSITVSQDTGDDDERIEERGDFGPTLQRANDSSDI